MSKGITAYLSVYNSAIMQQVTFTKEHFADFDEARKFKADIQREYCNIGCHKVSLLIEIFPESEEDEFDEDEMEEIAEIDEE